MNIEPKLKENRLGLDRVLGVGPMPMPKTYAYNRIFEGTDFT